MDKSILINHLFISLVAWLVGMALGGSSGYLFAHKFFDQTNKNPIADWKTILFPWRSLIFVVILFVWSPFLVIWLGLGNLTGTVMVGLTLSLLALTMTMTTIFHNEHPLTTRVLFISNARSLILIALFATLGVGYVGAGGFGFYLSQQLNLLNYDKLIEGILILSGIALALDLILGWIQYLVTQKTMISQKQ